jgi:hypothetical protein
MTLSLKVQVAAGGDEDEAPYIVLRFANLDLRFRWLWAILFLLRGRKPLAGDIEVVTHPTMPTVTIRPDFWTSCVRSVFLTLGHLLCTRHLTKQSFIVM